MTETNLQTLENDQELGSLPTKEQGEQDAQPQFSDLGLSPTVLDAVHQAGYTTPTQIQAQAIPSVLEGHDVVGIAQTGTGKTASFTLPILCKLETGRARARMPRMLILEPTRELAAQVHENIELFGLKKKLNVALLIGGVSFVEQNKILDRGADILIATPGRLLDHFERGHLLLTGVQTIVLDEADRMLDMGFMPDVERICSLLPPRRQTLFFSATMPEEIERLAAKFLTKPKRFEVARQNTTASTITHSIADVGTKPHEKRAALRAFIRDAEGLKNAIIFCNRKRDIATLTRSLVKHGFDAGAMHGDMDQSSRMDMLQKFKDGAIKLLVASDVAARGLDIPAVSHVFNYDVPRHAEDYVHRIGRTGRAGRSGVAITLSMAEDAKYVAAIEALTNASINRLKLPNADSEAGDDLAKAPQPRIEEKTPRSVPNKEAANSNRRESRGQKRDRNPPKERIIGMGDHVPAFLLRPVQLPN